MNDRVQVAIVGGGITGLAAAMRLTAALEPGSVLLLESDDRLGGKITTEHTGGLVIEGGPDCFLAMKPGGMALCRELGIEDRVRGTNPAFRRTYIRRGGRLHELPEGLSGLVPSRIGPLLKTSLLSPLGRIRAGLEMLVPRGEDREESIAEFVGRRFGREAYDWLVEPLLSGIYAGDGTRLSLAATFPQLVQIEREHGSVVRHMMRSRMQTRKAAAPAGPGFVTTAGGLGELVDQIQRRLPEGTVRTGVQVVSLEQDGEGYILRLEDGGRVHAGQVLLATPAWATAGMLQRLAPRLAEELAGIPYATSATVSLAFPASQVRTPLDGYGYVSPRAEGGDVVACTWTSNKFPDRVPADQVLVRFFVGRAGRDGIVSEDDATILAVVRGELNRISGITAEPTVARVFRWPRGMPQYHVGHRARVDRIERDLRTLPGLLVAGSAYRGAGIPDCISQGWAAADRMLAHCEAAA